MAKQTLTNGLVLLRANNIPQKSAVHLDRSLTWRKQSEAMKNQLTDV